jgi:hypothetical protein
MAVVILGGPRDLDALNLFVLPALYLRFGASAAPAGVTRLSSAAMRVLYRRRRRRDPPALLVRALGARRPRRGGAVDGSRRGRDGSVRMACLRT